MTSLPALRKSLPLAALLACGLLALSIGVAEAQQGRKGSNADQGPYFVQPGPRGGVGGYSLRLSDIWGPAKMPPAPKDFGPHFDFPPEPLNGAPLHDPYPN
jgi:hypothetical protein